MQTLPHIHIISCKDSMLWYADSIGHSFELLYEDRNEYVVRASDGYSNIVLKKDGYLVNLSCKERQRVLECRHYPLGSVANEMGGGKYDHT